MANMIVAGAGATAVNGTYVENGTFNGSPNYTYSTCSLQQYEYMPGAFRWGIRVGATIYYYSNNAVATPDLCTTWDKAPSGILPVPTVTLEQSGTTHEGEATLSSFSYLRTKKA